MTTFQKISSHFIPVLQATIEQYAEPSSGALHVHMLSEQAELAFLVGFPTVPTASDGRAHILEHLALCGSRDYPLTNPFFAMMRRSTATFMNALTYADRTVYPFASTDRKDFFNLLDVYLDATFFPRLDYLSFRQEGWRHALEDGKLAYRGVVFNEMKGTLNNRTRVLSHAISRILLEGTTYAVDSGGDPLVIPNLTHEMVRQFHAAHYHPSQALFLTAGSIAAADVQARIGERVLARFSGTKPRVMPELAVPWSAPRQTEILVPSASARADEHGFQLAWLMGETSNSTAASQAYLLMRGLLGNASAPLARAMESIGFGRRSPMNGTDSGARQIVFHLGMEGLTLPQNPAARACILEALERTAEAGVPASLLRAALRDLRVGQREVRGGGMPDGLGRLLMAVPVLMRGGDVLTAFDNETVVDALDQQIDDPAFFKRLVRALLDNPSCLSCTVVPDAEFFVKRDAIERARLAAEEATLTDADRRRILDESRALDALQSRKSDPGLLPRIRPDEVSAEARGLPALVPVQPGGVAITVPSNGISYAQVFHDLGHLPESDWPWLALYVDVLAQLGAGERRYDAASAWRQSLVPVFGMAFEALPLPLPKPQAMGVQLRFHASGLREAHTGIVDVIHAWTRTPRFDELERLRYLIEARIENRMGQVAQMGNQYAALAATAPFSPTRRFENIVRGTGALAFCAVLRGLLESPAGLRQIADTLRELHERIVASPGTVVCAGLPGDAAELCRLLQVPRDAAPHDSQNPSVAESVLMPPANAALLISGQVNHCVIAWAAPGIQHPQAPALAVAAELIGNTLLHESLREKGGAYGGSASYSGDDGVFSMSSYRDPRLAGTYADFAVALERTLNDAFSEESLEEAIICVIKRLDRPLAPHGQAMHAWALGQRGITLAHRQQFRRRVLGCTVRQVREAVRCWLHEAPASRAAAVGDSRHDLAGLDAVDLLAVAAPSQFSV